MLSIFNHDRDSAGLRYVYPVLSRRAGGVSLGINLNTNRACNWACVYCQVENLQRGKPEAPDYPQLARELTGLLHDILQGDFLQRHAPANARRLVDIAFSGDGEPTAVADFSYAVHTVLDCLNAAHVNLHDTPLRLITNGSLMNLRHVQDGVALLGKAGGEVWFKVDRADESMTAINGVPFVAKTRREQLAACCRLAPTWIQSCWFYWDDEAPNDQAIQALVDFLRPFAAHLRGVLLYGMARPSAQPDARRIRALSAEELSALGQQLQQAIGIEVRVSP